jgi:hypothetical protein
MPIRRAVAKQKAKKFYALTVSAPQRMALNAKEFVLLKVTINPARNLTIEVEIFFLSPIHQNLQVLSTSR